MPLENVPEGATVEVVAVVLERRPTLKHVPSVRTIGRILSRHGALDGRGRVVRDACPLGRLSPRPDISITGATLPGLGDSFAVLRRSRYHAGTIVR